MSGLKKDELLAVCGRQSELLEELRSELAAACSTIQARDEELSVLRTENANLRSELERTAAAFQSEWENLSAGYRSSMEILNRSWSGKLNELETSLQRQLESGLTNLAARPAAPDEYEHMLTAWFTDFLADLESSLGKPPA